MTAPDGTDPQTDSHETSRSPGLRVQIVLALAGVILVAYVPLFFAIAQVTRATALSYREDAARALGRTIAAHACDLASAQSGASASARIENHIGEGGALAIVVVGAAGEPVASSGAEAEVASIRAPSPPFGESSTRVSAKSGRRALEVVLPCDRGAAVVRVRADEDAGRGAGVVRGVALYMGVFALALLFVAYLVLTRAIVRPIEKLARAADHVKTQGTTRTLEFTASGARELVELASSVRAMAARLIEDDKTLRAKIEELTTTTRHLGETREQLAGSDRLAGVGRLAAGVAHEIGNPIAAIMGMHDLMAAGDLPDDVQSDFLRRMRKETERIHVVVRDLLEYARPESGPSSGAFAVADVAEIVNDAVALVRPQKEWKNVVVHVDVSSGLKVTMSGQRLTQVLLNLLLNAAASVASKAPNASKSVTIRARPLAEGRARIDVEDDGPGVPADMRDRVFDPFVTTKEVGSGTGLGLAVCRGIVQAAGGRIYVDATYTQGARFTLELPAVMPLT